MKNNHRRILTLAIAAAIPFLCSPVAAQPTSRAEESTVNEARRRRDAGDLAGAVTLLRPYVARHASQIDSSLTLAQLLYWLKDNRGARSVYEQILSAHPESSAVRLEYGQMLLETADHRRLREVVTPCLDDPRAQARAEALLARSAYWQGDLMAARRGFKKAVQLDPGLADAQAGLREIEAGRAIWLRVAADAGHDDQPLDRRGANGEIGWYATPVTTISARASWTRLHSDDALRLTTPSGVLRITHYAAAAQTTLEAEGGLQGRTDGAATAIGRIGIGVKPGGHATARVSGAREVYLYTLASLGTPVVTKTAKAALSLDHPRGWLGEAAIQRQWYPDSNGVDTAYAWLLAPVVQQDRRRLQIGYSLSSQDADESRFVLTSPQLAVPAAAGYVQYDGRYAPYYTPAHVVTHSLLVEAMARSASSVTLRLGGAYGVHATEDAPVLQALSATPRTITRTSYVRSFKPWTAHASVEFKAGSRTTVALSAESSRSAFYQNSTAGIQMYWRSGGR